MKYRYVENCASGFVEIGGVKFPHGEAVEVDPGLAEKLDGMNGHFAKVQTRKKKSGDDKA